MKKKIITQTILFISIILFVNIFTNTFGVENSLVGISTVIASLILLEKNLTHNPLISFVELAATNLLIGTLAFIANQNIILGALINFIVLASIGYIFSYNISKRLIIPFGLQYLFLFYAPIEASYLGKRLLALFVGAIFVMLIQFIAHMKKERNPETEESLLCTEGDDDHDDTSVILFGREFNLHPIRAKYAIRVGLLTAITTLITSYFGLEQGKWIAFTVFSITEFYSEHCKIRSKERMKGTLIGALIVIITFIIIKDTTIRSLVILMAGYFNPFTENYKDSTICITVSSVASAALTDNTLSVAITRIVYVFIGIVISLLANKFILKTSKKDLEKYNINN